MGSAPERYLLFANLGGAGELLLEPGRLPLIEASDGWDLRGSQLLKLERLRMWVVPMMVALALGRAEGCGSGGSGGAGRKSCWVGVRSSEQDEEAEEGNSSSQEPAEEREQPDREILRMCRSRGFLVTESFRRKLLLPNMVTVLCCVVEDLV